MMRSYLQNESTVVLAFLSGTHVILENRTLKVFNLLSVDIQAWNEQQEVVIDCQMHASFVFRDITKLKMISLNLTFCNLQCLYQVIDIERTVYIEKSVFEGSKNYAGILAMG